MSDPVADARWALAEVRRELGDLPVCLLGHSMGARTAVHVADEQHVVGVVGLAPWWPADEPVDALRGKRLVGAHGRRDRITSYRQSARFVARAADVAASAELRDMGHSATTCCGASAPGTTSRPRRRWRSSADEGCQEFSRSFFSIVGMRRPLATVLDETKPFRFIHVTRRHPT